ncbi:MAG: Tim44-like domain-containing protein [Sulfuricella sp.]|nr:Tim44-like domain-containing protein [Sulfuricella sp.]
MSKIFTLFFVALISFGLTAQDADAKRMGGGSSIGKQRSTTSQQTATPPKPAQAPAAAPAPAGGNKWLGPLAGLAAGGLLASMFMGGGLGGLAGGIGNILMILALVGGAFFIFRMLRKPQPQPVQYAGHTERTAVTDIAAPAGSAALGGSAAPGAAVQASSTRPAWFEDEPFLREAKKQFLRLQDANDRGDINDIREYVTPEMYAEISMQIQERNGKPNKTEVVTLNADIADVVTEGDTVIASVRFSGMIREEANAPAETFSEIWHIQKSQSQSQPNATWFISGIQQV